MCRNAARDIVGTGSKHRLCKRRDGASSRYSRGALGQAHAPAASRSHDEFHWKSLLNPHFHFETLPPNLWIVAIIYIHAGVNAMQTLWRSVPNG
jgi:hypothetical protein